MSSFEFVRPDFLTDDKITEQAIHQRMLTTVAERNIDITEGGFAWDMTRPSAAELAQAYQLLIATMQIMFPAWAYSGWLDLHGLASGVYRKDATASAGTLHIKGIPNLTIETGFELATPAKDGVASVVFKLNEKITLLDPNKTGTGVADALVTCAQTGTVGNVPANSITLMVSPKSGVSSVNNADAFTGGAEEESDDDYRDRIMANDLETEESYVGSTADFARWAKTIEGVGNVVVIDTWNGPQTVKLVVVDTNHKPANQAILDKVYNFIMSPDDANKRLAPIGCLLTVVAPVNLVVNVSVSVTINPSIASQTVVLAALKSLLNVYYNEAAADGIIRVTRMGSIVGSITGVLDYSALTINGGTANITLTSEQYPCEGMIEVTCI